MPQKIRSTNRGKPGSEDKTINGKAATAMTAPGYIKHVHNQFAASNNGGAADYTNPKHNGMSFEREHLYMDLNAVEQASTNDFDSGLTGTSVEKFIEFLNNRDWTNL